MKQKKSSTVSAKQAIEALTAVGYSTRPLDQDHRIRPTERANYQKNPGIDLSNSGKSINLYFNGSADEGRAPQVFVPAKGMLSIGQAETLEKQAKIKFNDFKQR
ncbi:hypothetical protein [Micavibrio aeruginosavorus]|uniref:Uncharacterized protein n=1 Tax=Micavibrio aeruginosavorus EPB TaxID=349215 RepID=M4VJD2_9BACT|nr:hypothetical protein [Micavibrio aeruginosavorus]AGH98161.1 hypothetical protein A11S_1352 [Micavibrio aeruginosavorus EPB]